MKIQLESWKIKQLDFSALSEQRADNSFALRVGQIFEEQDTSRFIITFNVELKDKLFDLTIEASFFFSTEGQINEVFKVSNFPKINAPAIAFPYLRAFISNLTLQSGFEPVILPSLNFVKLADEE